MPDGLPPRRSNFTPIKSIQQFAESVSPFWGYARTLDFYQFNISDISAKLFDKHRSFDHNWLNLKKLPGFIYLSKVLKTAVNFIELSSWLKKENLMKFSLDKKMAYES